MEKIFDTVDSLYEEYVEFFKEAVAIESPTSYKAGVDAVGNYIAERAEKHGWKVERAAMEKSGDAVCITMNPEIDAPAICFSGHIDTVHPVGYFGENPVNVDFEKDRITGPGVEDCKGGIVGAFLAMDALQRNGYKKRPVKLLLQSDEENSSATSNKETIKYLCECAKGAVGWINLEPTNGKITVQRKGILKYKFSVKGKARHASTCFDPSCASAINEAAQKIIELEKNREPDGLTFSCGLISGGTAVNTVPAECEFSFDIRYPDEQAEQKAHEIVKRIAETSYVNGTSCQATLISKRLSMPYRKENYDLYDKICSAFQKHGLQVMEYESRRGGSDAADVTAYGIPVVDGLGVRGGGGHTINEFVTLSSLKTCAKRLCAIAEEI